MSEAHTLPVSGAAYSADDLAVFLVAVELNSLPYAKRLRRLEQLEDAHRDTLAEAEGRFNVYPLRGGMPPPAMDAARLRAAAMARVALAALAAYRRRKT